MTKNCEWGFCIIRVLFDKKKQPYDYLFEEVNSEFEKHTGLKNAVGKTMRQLAENQEEFWFKTYGRVALLGEPVRFEEYSAAFDRQYEVEAFRIDKPEKRRVAINFRDVSDDRDLKIALRDGEKSFRQLSARYSDGIYQSDFSGKLVAVNQKFCTLLDYQESELVGQSIAKFMHPDEATENICLLERMRADGMPYRLTQPLFCRDGKTIAVKISVLPICNGTGKSKLAHAVVIDKSDRQSLKSRLQTTERRFLQVTDIIQDVFWISDLKKPQTLYLSPAFEQIWGYSREEQYRDYYKWTKAIHPDDRQKVLETIPNLHEQNRGEIEYRILRPDGSVCWIEARTFGIRDYSGEISQIVGVARDVSDRKQAEIRLKQSNQRLKFIADTSVNLLKHFQSDEVIFETLNRAASLLKLKYYSYYLLAEDENYLELQASMGIDETISSELQKIKISESVCGTCVEYEGRIELKEVQNSSEPQYKKLRSLGITAYACYSLIVKDRSVGTISFGKDTENSFNAEETTLLRTVADLVAIALERKLYKGNRE